MVRVYKNIQQTVDRGDFFLNGTLLYVLSLARVYADDGSIVGYNFESHFHGESQSDKNKN